MLVFVGQTGVEVTAPFLVSALPGSDDGEMDASLLMSPSYSPPLVASELQALVSMLFEPETMNKLRHISVRKFLVWREKLGLDVRNEMALTRIATSNTIGTGGGAITDHLALARRNTSPSSQSRATPTSAFNLNLNAPSPSSSLPLAQNLPDFTRSRIRDHVAREERVASIHLAKWAADLQRSIRREREEYARLVEGERARWLLRRVGEEASAGRFASIDAYGNASMQLEVASGRREGHMKLPSWARGGGSRAHGSEADGRDPLGLVSLADWTVRTGDLVLRALGGGVIVGAVWMVIVRAWGGERWFGWFGVEN